MNSSSSSELHASSSGEPRAHEPQFKSNLNTGSSSDMNSGSSSIISPELSPELKGGRDGDFDTQFDDFGDPINARKFEQARPPRANALRPLKSITRKGNAA